MLNFLSKWLKVYRDEVGLFLWSSLLFLIIRSADIVFNNFAETAFLKRFGVEYLPMVYMINSVSTFFIMSGLSGVMARVRSSRLLMYTLLFSGASVAGLRFVIPLGFGLVYPVIYILKMQYEILLSLLFWDLANDLFNMRQSKRLFPLITAGGVLGGIAGSFGTPYLARAVHMDNLMLGYLGMTLLGAATVKGMASRYPSLLFSAGKEEAGGAGAKPLSSIKEEIAKILPLMKESKLLWIMILITLLPNIAIPILNYQFNFAVNATYATEGKMLTFFSFFRGGLNVISFLILLFVGRVYGRWGVPVALMFHPINYAFAFLAFFFRFNVFSAMYARISTTVLRTTINNPARAVLFGLFPSSYRNFVRPFLRGTVVRVGVLFGSGVIIVSEGMFHPKHLSLLGVLVVSGWIASTLYLKRNYSKILLDLLSKDQLDLKSFEKEDVGRIFMDREMRAQLVRGCLSTEGDECIWYARMLQSLGREEMDQHLLTALEKKDDETKIGLLSLLSPHASKKTIHTLRALVDHERPQLTAAVAKTASRLDPELSDDFLEDLFQKSEDPEVRAYSIAGLYRRSPDRYGRVIDEWLHSDSIPERRAGVVAAGESNEPSYIEPLKGLLRNEEDESVVPLVLNALGRLEDPKINETASAYLTHPSESVRLAALTNFRIEGDQDLRTVIALLGDASERVHDLAKEKLRASSYQNPQTLIGSLAIPKRRTREGIFYLLESLDVKEREVFRFAWAQLELAYRSLAEYEGVRRFPEGAGRSLLMEHVDEERHRRLDNILRVLATQDHSGRMRIIWRGVSSTSGRQRSNSLEALERLMEPTLAKVMVPLLENLSPAQSLAVGRKNFQLPDFDSDRKSLLTHFLSKEDWVSVILALYMLIETGIDGLDAGVVRDLAGSENIHVRRMAQKVLENQPGASGEEHRMSEVGTNDAMSIPEKILHLRGIEIFKDLTVNELAAVASVTREVSFSPGELIIEEGEPGDTMYLILDGEVSVIKGKGTEHEIELDRIKGGDYFGEMALFEDEARSATIKVEKASRLLVLHKQEFTEIVREYPQIALHICRELSHRIRRLHEKIRSYEK